MTVSHNDGVGQLVVDVIATVLDGDGAAPSAPGNNGDGFAAVAAKGEQKGLQRFIAGLNAGDDIFLTAVRIHECHKIT